MNYEETSLLTEEPRNRYLERVCQRGDHVESRVAMPVLDAGQIRGADARARRNLVLPHSRALAEFTHAATERHTRRLASMQNLTRHPHTLWPLGRLTTSRRVHA